VIQLFYIFDPRTARYMVSTETGIAWVPLKSAAETFHQELAAGLLDSPAFAHCLSEYAASVAQLPISRKPLEARGLNGRVSCAQAVDNAGAYV
jgi:hypothetical protein